MVAGHRPRLLRWKTSPPKCKRPPNPRVPAAWPDQASMPTKAVASAACAKLRYEIRVCRTGKTSQAQQSKIATANRASQTRPNWVSVKTDQAVPSPIASATEVCAIRDARKRSQVAPENTASARAPSINFCWRLAAKEVRRTDCATKVEKIAIPATTRLEAKWTAREAMRGSSIASPTYPRGS